MFFTDVGSVISFNEVQLLKVSFSIFVSELEMKIFCKDEHIAKALSPMLVTELGIVICFKEVHSSKTFSPKFVTESGIVICCKEVQPSNASSPIRVIVLGKTLVLMRYTSKKLYMQLLLSNWE